MSIISNKSYNKILTNDTLSLAAQARKNKLLDKSVINATIGTLFDENGDFYKMPTVDKIIKNLSDEDFYSYSSVDGGKEYIDAVTNWVFGEDKKEIVDKLNCKVVATSGGTGAVCSSIFTSLDRNEIILLPDLYWGPYYNMAEVNELEVREYQYIKNNKFNFDSFVNAANDIIKKQNKLVTILNDPCNNPTGYCLSDEEFNKLIDYMNSKPEVSFHIIYDIAYFDYHKKGYKESRSKFKLMLNANSNVLFSIAFSCSKSFSMYGMRTGAQIILNKDYETVNRLYEITKYFARTHWSNISKAGINALVALTNNKELLNSFEKELEFAKTMISKRGELFTKEAEECGLKIIPYIGGFFITILCDNSKLVAEELIRQKIYVLSLKKGLRIAICCLPLNEIYGLANKINNVIHNIK